MIIVTCRSLVELATEYQEGTLSPPRRVLVRAHLSWCAHCRAYLAQLAATTNAMAALASEPTEAIDTSALRERLRQRRAR